MTGAAGQHGGHGFDVGDTVELLSFVGARGRWLRALAGAAGCVIALVPALLFLALVARGVVPVEIGVPDAPSNRGGFLHWIVAFAWVSVWGIGVVVMLQRAAFLRSGRPRAWLTRVDGGWLVQAGSQRSREGFTVLDGGELHIGRGRLLGLRPSPRPTQLVVHAGRVDRDAGATSIDFPSHARRDELSVRAAIEALEFTGSRLVIAETDSCLRLDI